MRILLAIGLSTGLMGSNPTDYKVLEVRVQSVFAGRLGERIREDLVVEGGGGRITIHVAGDYHTQTTRSAQRFLAGDHIRVRRLIAGGEASIDRRSISIIRP